MFVDDGMCPEGNPSCGERIHRNNIMNKDYNKSGVWSCFWDFNHFTRNDHASNMVDVQYAIEYTINDSGHELAAELAQVYIQERNDEDD